MKRRCLVLWLTLLSVVLLMPMPAAAQTRTATADEWIPPRTPDGQPDISGIFTFRNLTPLSRPTLREAEATDWAGLLAPVRGLPWGESPCL